MLSEVQRMAVWEGWLGAEVRAYYFADLSQLLGKRQRLITWATLAFSSGAFITLLADWVPARLAWVRPVLAALTAALSLWSLVAQNQKTAADAADLSFKWNRLAAAYQALWDRMYDADALAGLTTLRATEDELSKTSTLMAHSYSERRMAKWEDRVFAERQARRQAA